MCVAGWNYLMGTVSQHRHGAASTIRKIEKRIQR
jgi:hypothetical protein